jgi:hypothetical protein
MRQRTFVPISAILHISLPEGRKAAGGRENET